MLVLRQSSDFSKIHLLPHVAMPSVGAEFIQPEQSKYPQNAATNPGRGGSYLNTSPRKLIDKLQQSWNPERTVHGSNLLSQESYLFIPVGGLSDKNIQPTLPDRKTRLAPQAQINFFGSEESGLVGAVGSAVVIDTCGFAREEEFSIQRASQLAAHFRSRADGAE